MAMTRSDIFEQAKAIFAKQLGISKPDEVTRLTDLVEKYGADDLDCVEIVMDLESKFGISISDDDCENFVGRGTEMKFPDKFIVGECVDYICNRLGVK